MSCVVGHRRGSDPTLLWLWCRSVATAPIRPLAWQPPYVTGSSPRKDKRKEGREEGRTRKEKKRKEKKRKERKKKKNPTVSRPTLSRESPTDQEGPKGDSSEGQTWPKGLQVGSGLVPPPSPPLRYLLFQSSPLSGHLSRRVGGKINQHRYVESEFS